MVRNRRVRPLSRKRVTLCRCSNASTINMAQTEAALLLRMQRSLIRAIAIRVDLNDRLLLMCAWLVATVAESVRMPLAASDVSPFDDLSLP